MGAATTFLLGLSTAATALGVAYFAAPDTVNGFIVGKNDTARAVLAAFSVLLGAAFIALAGVLCTVAKAANASVMRWAVANTGNRRRLRSITRYERTASS
jgi:hypothetical protein